MSSEQPTDAELLERAVRSARNLTVGRHVAHPRWVAVMWAFSLGSTYARKLVKRFDLDPDEMVKATRSV
jgi:hypothetical protein